MKFLRVFLFSLILLCIGSKAYSDSLVINYINNKPLYKWDGKNLINYSNNKKLYKLNGNTVSVYSTNKKILKIDGLIPIPILIALVTEIL